MTVALKKWGNSLALRIPKDVAKTLCIDDNSILELKVESGKIVLEPKSNTLLEKLVSQINSDNLHKEIDTGKLGNEEW